MATECRQDSLDFGTVEGRSVVGAFDGGVISSDAGALLLGATDRAIRLIGRFAACFTDRREAESIEHTVTTLVGQRVVGIALGYEDLNDHDELRHDPVMAVLAGKLKARRKQCAPVAGKSTLSRLEHAPEEGVAFAPPRYHKISHDARAIEELFGTLFLEAHGGHRSASSLILMPPIAPYTGIRRGVFSTATMIATAICRSTSSAADICWQPSCAAPTSMPRQVQSRRLRAWWRRSGRAGPK